MECLEIFAAIAFQRPLAGFLFLQPGVAHSLLRRKRHAPLRVDRSLWRIGGLHPREGFYSVHSDKPFFNDLISYMISGPVIVQVLDGEDAINKYREVMGATNPENAANGSIRNIFGLNIQENSVHGSDSEENANKEITYFFNEEELFT